jgi:hypothetical protein
MLIDEQLISVPLHKTLEQIYIIVKMLIDVQLKFMKKSQDIDLKEGIK